MAMLISLTVMIVSVCVCLSNYHSIDLVPISNKLGVVQHL